MTRPTKRMREAMAAAAVGDDCYGDDPTMNELEARIAALFGKERAMFVPSGTQSNLIGMMVNVRVKGEAAILGHMSHIYNIERGGISAVGGIHPIVVRNLKDGTLDMDELKSVIPPNSMHLSQPRVIALESTQNLCNGKALSLEYINNMGKFARDRKLRLHLDGARCLNASVYINVDPEVMVRDFDTVNLCLSKGLGCPVGSLVIGTEDDIAHAKVLRKMLGGQMRQTGMLAACGLIALEGWKDRLTLDHRNALEIGEQLRQIEGIEVMADDIHSNILRYSVKEKLLSKLGVDHAGFCGLLKQKGVLMNPSFQNDCIRIVTHSDFKTEQIAQVVKVFKDLAFGKF